MADWWRDEDRDGRGSRGGEYRGEREGEWERGFGAEDERRGFGERGYRDFGRGYGRDYGSEGGRHGGFRGRGLGAYNPRSDYDRGSYSYSPEYGQGPLYGGGSERDFSDDYGRPYGSGREYERDYGRTPGAAFGREGLGDFGREGMRSPGARPDFRGEGLRGERERSWWDRAGDEVRSWWGRDESGRGEMGGFRGRGPRGYTRSDDRIREDLCDRLSDDPTLDASNIDVEVSNGEVTLSGSVDDRQDKRRAEDCAESISGVKNVQNMLRVEQGAPATTGTAAGGQAAPSEPTRTTNGATARE
jgi:hypothetical protein